MRDFGNIATFFIIGAIVAFPVSGWTGVIGVLIGIYFSARFLGILTSPPLDRPDASGSRRHKRCR